MTEFRDFSRLPDDPAYWAELEARVLAAAGDGIDDATEPPGPLWTSLGRRAGTLASLAAAAAIATLLLAPPRRDVEPAPAVTMLGSPIGDPALARFVAAPAPPAISNLLADRSMEVPR